MENQERGNHLRKVGAKTYRMWQPCDVADGLKTMGAPCKKATTSVDYASLEQSVKEKLDPAPNQGRMLDCCKLDATRKDLGCCPLIATSVLICT
jgi:hypothetical protein